MFKKTLLHALITGLATTFLLFGTANASPDDNDFTVTLLGTGDPDPYIERFSMSTLVQAGDQNLLFDVGRGTAIRLWQSGLIRGHLNATFITHMHSDHLVGLPDLFETGWTNNHYSPTAEQGAFVIYGPSGDEHRIGIAETMKRIKSSFAADQYIRANDEHYDKKGLLIDAHEIDDDGGVVYEKNGVKVTAFPVLHGNFIEPAFGYRIDYDGRSVVISGDTKYTPDGAIMTMGKDVNLLIHEVAIIGDKMARNPKVGEAVKSHHVTPEQAGKVFSQLNPDLAVYSHIVYAVDDNEPFPSDDELIQRTRKTYDGKLDLGSDLTTYVIGQDSVKILDPITYELPVAPRNKLGPLKHNHFRDTQKHIDAVRE